MQAFRKRTTTAAVVAVLAIAPFSGAQAQSVHADDRTYFASAASEQTARDALGKRVEALQQASTLAPAERFQQAEALEALKRPDTLLIDVRTAEEYAEGAIPGSIRIGSEELRARIAAVAPDKDQPVVLYCRSGRRSSAAQDLLQQLGYRQVINGGGYEQLREAIQDQ